MKNTHLIPCTVGMLTYNSGATLARALESVKDFAEIIIADGGSTDDTRAIAGRYGAKIIEQSTPGQPIADFARERNRLLDTATCDWFFWLDSDEFISRGLHDEIAEAVRADPPARHAYEIHIVRTTPDGTTPYKELWPNHQIRLFNRKTGGRFEKPIHEKFVFDRAQYRVGRLRGAWYVPLNKTEFSEYRRVVGRRLSIMVAHAPPRGLVDFVRRGVFGPLVNAGKIIIKALLTRVRFPLGPVMPLWFELYRIYAQWMHMREQARRYFGKRRKKIEREETSA